MSIEQYYLNEFNIQREERSRIRHDSLNDNYDVQNCKIICFFAEKGGVGKTTNAQTLAYTFAENGHRVVICDCDSQRSLTASILGLEITANPDNFVDVLDPLGEIINQQNIDNERYVSSLYDQVRSNNNIIKPAHAILIRENLWLVPGDRNISELDQIISNEELASSPNFDFIHHNNSKTGKPYQAILRTAEEYQADYVFLDLSPNKGPFNRCLVMASHYVIISATADYHSAEMMSNVEENFTNWCRKTNEIRNIFSMPNRMPIFNLPESNPKFLGFILNRVDSNKIGEIVNGIEDNRYRRIEQFWAKRVQHGANNLSMLSQFLDDENYREPLLCPMAVSNETYERCNRTNRIGVVRQFWGLKNFSDAVHIPVPFLNERHIIEFDNDRVRQVRNNEQINSIETFRRVFDEIYKTIKRIIAADD